MTSAYIRYSDDYHDGHSLERNKTEVRQEKQEIEGIYDTEHWAGQPEDNENRRDDDDDERRLDPKHIMNYKSSESRRIIHSEDEKTVRFDEGLHYENTEEKSGRKNINHKHQSAGKQSVRLKQSSSPNKNSTGIMML